MHYGMISKVLPIAVHGDAIAGRFGL
jgi:hypothetical protein